MDTASIAACKRPLHPTKNRGVDKTRMRTFTVSWFQVVAPLRDRPPFIDDAADIQVDGLFPSLAARKLTRQVLGKHFPNNEQTVTAFVEVIETTGGFTGRRFGYRITREPILNYTPGTIGFQVHFQMTVLSCGERYVVWWERFRENSSQMWKCRPNHNPHHDAFARKLLAARTQADILARQVYDTGLLARRLPPELIATLWRHVTFVLEQERCRMLANHRFFNC